MWLFTIISLQILKNLPVFTYGHLCCHIVYTRLCFMREIKCYSLISSVFISSLLEEFTLWSDNLWKQESIWTRREMKEKQHISKTCNLKHINYIFFAICEFYLKLVCGWLYVLDWIARGFFLTDFYKTWYTSCLYRASTVSRHYFITPNLCSQL